MSETTTRNYVRVPAVHLKALSEKLGRTETADALGVVPGTVTKHVAAEETSRSLEMAAQLHYEKLYGKKNERTEVTVLVRMDKEYLKMMDVFVRGVGGKAQIV